MSLEDRVAGLESELARERAVHEIQYNQVPVRGGEQAEVVALYLPSAS